MGLICWQSMLIPSADLIPPLVSVWLSFKIELSLYPTQRVAEGMMFLSCPSVRQTCLLFSATPLKPLNRISWNFVVMKDIMCRCAYPQEILIQYFFSQNYAFLDLEIWSKWEIQLKQFVSATPLKLLTRISWNFVVMKDIMGRYAFLQEMLILSF